MKKFIKLFALCLVTSSTFIGCESENSQTINSSNSQESFSEYDLTETKDLSKEVEIHFINTGNSDSILLKGKNQAMLIDGGENDDEETVVNYLKSQNIKKLDYIFATHPHADHIGGLDAVVDNFEVGNILVSNGSADTKTYRDFITSMANKNLNPSVPLVGSKFKFEDGEIEVLSAENLDDLNNNSLVLLFTNGEDKVLFMGDAEYEIEKNLDVPDVDLLKVGHHGSKTSSSQYFIKKANPEYAVILTGKNNKYNHPHSETLNTLNENNIEVHRTDECGDIVFVSTQNGVLTNCTVK